VQPKLSRKLPEELGAETEVGLPGQRANGREQVPKQGTMSAPPLPLPMTQYALRTMIDRR
jgi:hypothetical protein